MGTGMLYGQRDFNRPFADVWTRLSESARIIKNKFKIFSLLTEGQTRGGFLSPGFRPIICLYILNFCYLQTSTILDFGTRWRWVVSFTSRPLPSPRERAISTHWVGDWVGPRASLDVMEQRNISCPHRESNPGCPNGGVIPPLHHTSSWCGA
jgi:hypothetical protein